MNNVRDALLEVMQEQGELPDPGIQLDANATPLEPQEDVTQEDILKMLQEDTAPITETTNTSTPETTNSADPKFVDYVNSFLGGGNKLILSPVAATDELAENLANKVRPMMGKPVISPESPNYAPISKKLERTFYPKDYPDTRGTRMAEMGGKVVPEALAMMTGAELLRAPAMAVEAVGPVSRTVQALLRSSSAEPYAGKMLPIVRDIAGVGGAAGAGTQYAGEKTEGSVWQPLAEMAGGLGGGLAAAGPLAAIPSAAKNYYKYISPVGWANRLVVKPIVARDMLPSSMYEGQGIIGRTLRGIKDEQTQKALPLAAEQLKTTIQVPGVRESMQTAGTLRNEIPGFNPTLAEATGVPSLLATQSGMENQAAGDILDQLVKRKRASAEGIQSYMEQQAPGEIGDASISAPVQRRLQEVVEPIKSKLQNITDIENKTISELPNISRAETGEILRDRLETLRSAKQADMTAYADELGLGAASGLNVPTKGIKTAVTKVLPSKLATDVSRVMNKVKALNDDEPLTFADAKYLMESLGEESRILASQGRNNDSRLVTKARQAVDDFLQDEWAPALGIGEKYAAFRKRYLEEYINPFEKGITKAVKSVGPDMEYRTEVENVMGSYFGPGKVTAARDFKRTFGADPEANEALRSFVLDDINDKVVKDGAFDLKAFDKWHKAHADTLEEFPDIRDQVTRTKSLAEELSRRKSTLEMRKKSVQDSQLSKSIGNDDKIIDKMLADTNFLSRTVSKMTEGEKQALARKTWEKANTSDDPVKMKEFLDANRKPLNIILGEKHTKALDNIQSAVEMNLRTKEPIGRKSASQAFEKVSEIAGATPSQLLSRGFAVASGRTGIKYTLGDLLARRSVKMNQRAIDEVMNRALYDADFAEELSNYVKIKIPKPEQIRKFKGYLYSTGISATMGDTKQQQGEEK